MKSTGKVFTLTPVIEGQSDNGNFWSKRTLVIETTDDKSKKLAFEFFGDDRVRQLKDLNVGDLVDVNYIIDSHEHNGKWYTRLSGMGLKRYEPEKLQ